ncbi:hypothetical protein [Microbacterium soli]|uniref:Uncharacterized protein n=1 Tax=Microbacterium soli TaxID=446075 RepID=A0ABP7N3W4_9MICO
MPSRRPASGCATRTTGRGRAAAAAASLLVASVSAGCSGATVCPAIGWSNTLTVELGGDAAVVDRVQLCTDAGCAPAEDIDPSGPLGLVTVAEHDTDAWIFSVAGLPETFTVRALDVDGAVLTESEVAPEWTRTGGTERCGGPSEAVVSTRV